MSGYGNSEPPSYQKNELYPSVPAHPHQEYQHQQQMPTTTIVVNATNNGVYSSPFPSRVVCPLCNSDTVTKTRPVVGLLTYLLSFGLFMFCCWPCTCVPCCVDRCQDVEHRCGNCHRKIGLYKRI